METQVLSGVAARGMDIGKRLARQRKPAVWAALTDGQHERLEQLGIMARPGTDGGRGGEAVHGSRERLRDGRSGPRAVQGPTRAP
ncbi:helicase associated domain-containing protein [Streptomyces sp. NPDC005132]|uniref:helicase associated domain-containing protein n=1 Tax=Streptomyces sp. NPDC005132 TaxID=3154294 RepID=UPI0033BE64FA